MTYAEHVKAAQALAAQAKSENRDLSAEEVAKVNEHVAAAKAARAEADAAEAADAARLAAQNDLDALAADLEKPAPRKVAPSAATPVRAPAVAREGILSDPKRGWKHLGEFAMAVMGHGPAAPSLAADARLRAAATGMQQGVGAEGGFAVAPAFATSIWEGLSAEGVNLLDMVERFDLTGSESLTLNANAETSRANGSRYGGVRGYWISEAGQITSSAPKLRQVKIEPHQLAVLCYATDKLLKNAPALAGYLQRAASSEIRFLVNDAIVNGTGTGQPKGILPSGSIVSVAKESSQAAASVVTENVVKMMARMHPNSRSRGVWLANIDIEPQLMLASISIRNIAGSENVGGSAVPIYNPAAGTLMGRPILFVEGCATLGTTGDLIFWDPMSYVAGVQGGVEEAVSMHLRFDYAETAFRFMFAVDGQPWLASALTPFKGSNTLSTHVKLDTRA